MVYLFLITGVRQSSVVILFRSTRSSSNLSPFFLAIGVIGQYIGKVYLETKERPKYIVETYLSDENENSKEE